MHCITQKNVQIMPGEFSQSECTCVTSSQSMAKLSVYQKFHLCVFPVITNPNSDLLAASFTID